MTVAAITTIAAVAAVATTVATTITATVVAVSTAVATTATAEATTVTFRAGTSLVHNEVAAVEVLSVRAFDSCTAGVVIGHLHETEATATVGGAIHDDLGRSDLAERLEKFAEVLVLH